MTHALLSVEGRAAIDEMIGEMLPGQLREAVVDAVRRRSVLTPEVSAALSEIIASEVPRAAGEALDVVLGVVPARGLVEEATVALCEAIADLHARDLLEAAVELPDRLVAEFAGDVDEALLEMVVEDTVRCDEAAHAASQRLLEVSLRRAFAGPDRDRVVRAVLDAERERLVRRGDRRMVRALSRLRVAAEVDGE